MNSGEDIMNITEIADVISYLLLTLTTIIVCRRVVLVAKGYWPGSRDDDDDHEQERSPDSDNTVTRRRLILDRGPVLRGVHEIQESYEGEEGLQESWDECRKKSGHDKHIPISDFQVTHLPEDFRDPLLVDLVNAKSRITVRIQIDQISPKRPDKRPVNKKDYPRYLMTGTGCITKVLKMAGDKCLCMKCGSMKTPRKRFCELYLTTVTHVVHDDTEAENAMCRLGFDMEGGKFKSMCGFEVLDGHVDGDLCALKHTVHDKQFADELCQMWDEYCRLQDEVNKKYRNTDCRLAIIVGHPHGASKRVSVGEWTERMPMLYDNYFSQYRYTTTTCSGSSGSPVILPGRDCDWWFKPAHSSWDNTGTGLNFSAVAYDPDPATGFRISEASDSD